MRVHVINLETSIARRAAVERRLAALGIDYEIQRAVEGRAGHAAFSSCNLRQYVLNTGRAPSDGELGCYASHLLLWQRCADTREPLVVMEDDAEPLPTFVAALEAARGIVDRYGFIRLEYEGPGHHARTRAIEHVAGFTTHYFIKYPFGAMCYALSPAVARAFVAESRELRAPVDQFIKRYWEHRQPLYGLLPYTVREGPHAADSTIRARVKPPLPAGLRAQRALHKIGTGFRRAVFNWVRGPAQPNTS